MSHLWVGNLFSLDSVWDYKQWGSPPFFNIDVVALDGSTALGTIAVLVHWLAPNIFHSSLFCTSAPDGLLPHEADSDKLTPLLVLTVPLSEFFSVLRKAGLICRVIGNRRWRRLVKSCFVCLCRKLSPAFHQALLSFCRMSADSRLGSEVSGIG